MGCILAVLSFCLSLHTHTRLLKAGHTCVSVSWKCPTTTRSSTDVKDLLFQLSCQSRHCVHAHTHTPLPAVLFSTEWSHPGQSEAGRISSQCSGGYKSRFQILGRWLGPWSAPAVSSLHFLRSQQRCRGQPAVSGCHSACLRPGDALGSSTVITLSVSSLTSLRTTPQQLSDNPFVM